MPRKELWIPLAVVGLTVAFFLVSLLVRASRGNSWLIRRKLRLGALLLGLTWSATGCSNNEVTCYDPVPPDYPDEIIFDNEFWGPDGLVLDLSEGHAITGMVAGRESTEFAFQLVAADQTEVQRGLLVASDGAFDEEDEAFEMDLGDAVTAASYGLRIYRDGVDDGDVLVDLPLDVVPGE